MVQRFASLKLDLNLACVELERRRQPVIFRKSVEGKEGKKKTSRTRLLQ
jgi:hypothetical protein